MPQTMPAVVNFAPEPGCVEIREIPVPDFGDGDVLLKVGATGVCGSDLHQWQAQHSWPVNYPVVLGHEFAGTVVHDRFLGSLRHFDLAVGGGMIRAETSFRGPVSRVSIPPESIRLLSPTHPDP